MQKHDAISDTRKEAEIWINKAKLVDDPNKSSQITWSKLYNI